MNTLSDVNSFFNSLPKKQQKKLLYELNEYLEEIYLLQVIAAQEEVAKQVIKMFEEKENS
jgi:hypothetical protein